jgi:hypothetical protein
MLFKELKVFLSTAPILRCDNLSALALASNPVCHARTKHIEVDYHFIREKVLNRDVLLKFISTGDQIADIFTKGLSSARFLFLKSKLMVLSSPISLRGNVNMKVANATFKTKASEKGSSEERSNARMGAGSFATSESIGSRKARLRTITPSVTGSFATSESLGSRKARLRTIAPSVIGSFATLETPNSRRKAEIQYGKFWSIPCPPMTAYREGWLGHQDIFTIVLES